VKGDYLFVDNGELVDHHCFNFPFINYHFQKIKW